MVNTLIAFAYPCILLSVVIVAIRYMLSSHMLYQFSNYYFALQNVVLEVSNTLRRSRI